MTDLLRSDNLSKEESTSSGLLINAERIYRFFGEAAAARGEKYHSEHRVIDMGVSPRLDSVIIVGVVRGTKKYDVRIELRTSKNRNPISKTDCSCPIGGECKHSAALLFNYIAYCEEKQQLTGLDRRVISWLGELHSVAKDLPASGAAANASNKKIFYLIDYRLERNIPRLLIKACTATRKKSGELTSVQTHYLTELARSRAQYVSAEDARLLQMFAMTTQFSMFGEKLPVDPLIMEMLISMTLATGRCHWQDPESRPLREGPVRKGTISWKVTDDLRHIPELKAEDPEHMPLFAAQPLYINLKKNELGFLKLNMPYQLADTFLTGPAIKPEELEQVSKLLSPLHMQAKIPMPPSKFQIINLDQIPKPRLILHTIRNIDGKPLPQAQHFAVLRYVYGNIEINGRNPAGEIRVRQSDTVTCVQRNFDEERKIVAKLVQSGLIEIKAVSPPFEKDDLVFKAGVLNSELDWLRWLDLELDIALEQDEVIFDLGFGLKQNRTGSTAIRLEKSAEWWFNLNLGIIVDGKKIPLIPLLKECFKEFNGPITPEHIERLSIKGLFYIRLRDGSYVGLPVEQVKDIYTTLIDIFLITGFRDEDLVSIALTAGQALELKRAASMKKADVECSPADQAFLDRLESFSRLDDFSEPSTFTAELRPYQRHGCAWMQFLSDYRLGGILADDMGLGKTVQVLAHLLSEKERGVAKGPSLVVCPTSVGPNWVAEAARYAPGLKTALLATGVEILAAQHLQDYDLLITSYGLLMRHGNELARYSWHAVVLDEAQFIKNYKAKYAKSANTLKAHHRLCLTGTPIENNLGELFSQMNFVTPGLLGDSKKFRGSYQYPIERDNNQYARARLIARIKSFILRRTKDQVAQELPPKTIIVKPIDLEPGQRELYEVIRLAAFQKVREEIAARGLDRAQITILGQLLRLRQVCCDPRLPRVESKFRNASSAKLIALLDMINKLLAEGRKILVFSQFTSMLDLIEIELEQQDIEFVTLRGDTRDRKTPIKRFQNGEVSLFLLSLKAGGTGLNLTAADTVIHYDLWWNPAVESQATDRAHRIGQDKPVFVYKLIGRGTIEQRILELQARKNLLVQAILNDETNLLAKFNEADVNMLFDPIDVPYITADD